MSETATTHQTQTETPAPQVWPSLRAYDARALIRFLVDVVGFIETAVYSGDDGEVNHAELAWPPGGGVMLGSVRKGSAETSAVSPGSFAAYVVADDVDALHDRILAAGGNITRPLEDMDYGSREFAITDPEGNRWSFGTYRGHPRPVPPNPTGSV